MESPKGRRNGRRLGDNKTRFRDRTEQELTNEAGLSGPLRRTGAPEAINQILAGSSMTAGVHQTLVDT